MIAPSILFLLSLPLLGNTAAVTTVTLLALSPITTTSSESSSAPLNEAGADLPFPSPVYSPVGVGSGGLTTYIEEIQWSEEYHIEGMATATTTLSNGDIHPLYSYTTWTSTIPTQTELATFVQGASQYKYHAEHTASRARLGSEYDCHWGTDGNGECEMKLWDRLDPSSSTYTSTFSGTIGHHYTLVVSDTTSGQPSATSASSATRAVIGVSASLVGVVSIVVFVIVG